MLQRLAPTLWTTQLQETVDFYTSRLNFQCDSLNKQLGWASVSRDHVQIMLALPNDHVEFKGPQFSGSLYLFTDDVESEWFKLRDQEKICYPLEKFHYGMWEFAIFDINGYIIQFGQELGQGDGD